MKSWVRKLAEQFEVDWSQDGESEANSGIRITEERATLLFILDVYTRHLIDTDSHPARKARDVFDTFAKEILQADPERIEKLLFRFRQSFHSHRIDEYAYVQKTFDDFRGIVWDIVDQLSEDLSQEAQTDLELRTSLSQLKEAVESNSIEILKRQSRQFIDSYSEHQSRKDERRHQRVDQFKRHLDKAKKQLIQAESDLRTDHLTRAYNRKSFEEQAKNAWNLHNLYGKNVTVVTLDIDHFKKINDSYGHDMGDFILQECVKTLKTIFSREVDCIARVGGEEFAILLPDFQTEHAMMKADQALKKIRHETYIKGEQKLQFTVSMGIAELLPEEDVATWLKRADLALYESKQTGRNRWTLASPTLKPKIAV